MNKVKSGVIVLCTRNPDCAALHPGYACCPEDKRWAILGHEKKTVAAGYGKGFPVPMLKKWIDKIGF